MSTAFALAQKTPANTKDSAKRSSLFIASPPRIEPGLFQPHAVKPDLGLADVLGRVRRPRLVDPYVARLVDDLFLLSVGVRSLQRAARQRAHDAGLRPGCVALGARGIGGFGGDHLGVFRHD